MPGRSGRWPFISPRSVYRPEKTVKPWLRLRKWKIIRGDQVMILSGKDKGQIGLVREVIRKRNAVIVSDRNLVYKHVPKNESAPNGRIQKEMPIHVSNVALVHPETKLKTKIEIRPVVDPKTGKRENKRFVKGTSVEIPRPKYLEYQKAWVDTPLDTPANVVKLVTYQPTLAVPPLPEGVVDELRGKYTKWRVIKERKRIADLEAEMAALTQQLASSSVSSQNV